MLSKMKPLKLTYNKTILFVVLVTLVSIGLKVHFGVTKGYPLLPNIANVAFRVHYKIPNDGSIKLFDQISISHDKENLMLKSSETGAAFRVDSNFDMVTTYENCIGLRNTGHESAMIFCLDHDLLTLSEDRGTHDLSVENRSIIDKHLNHENAIYTGDGGYFSLYRILDREAISYSTGLLHWFVETFVHLFTVLVSEYGMLGFIFGVIVLRVTCCFHDLLQAKSHVYRVFHSPEKIPLALIIVNSTFLAIVTIFFIHCMRYLPDNADLLSSSTLMLLCAFSLIIRIFLQGSSWLSVESILLFALLIGFAFIRDSLPNYYFCYFATSSLLIGFIRYLASHGYARKLRTQYEQTQISKNAEVI